MLASVAIMAKAQTRDVPFNGLITDIRETPLKGVRVWHKDERRYARSDRKGRFGLTDVQPGDTIHLLYQKKYYDIPVDGKKSVKIRLADQIESAEEDDMLIDLGYGYVKSRECTVSRGGISGAELRKSGRTSILAALEGRIPGLNISSGGPFGQDHTVYIRGVNTFVGDSTPLYVVDGVVVNSLDFININDVDYVEVMKEGSIYGARGANGVISVHTYQGGTR